jgi:hypothetical protein
MFQHNFNYLSMNDIEMIDYDYGFYDLINDDDISDTISLDDFDLDPDYIPDSDDSSNEDD